MVSKFNEVLQVEAGAAFASQCDDQACFIRKPCGEVNAFMAEHQHYIRIEIPLTDSDGAEFVVAVGHERLFVDGDQISSRWADRCYLTVFPNNIDSSQDNIYLGNIFLASYYVVYDATPADEHGWDFLQVGIAPQAEAPPVLQEDEDTFTLHDGKEYTLDDDIPDDAGAETDGTGPAQPDGTGDDDDGEATAIVIVVATVVLILAGGVGIYCCSKQRKKKELFAPTFGAYSQSLTADHPRPAIKTE